MKLILTTICILFLCSCSTTKQGDLMQVKATAIETTVCNDEEASTLEILAYGGAGGVIGNQFGDGKGKKIATIAGAALGASYATNKGKCESPYIVTIQYYHPKSNIIQFKKIPSDKKLPKGYPVFYTNRF